MSFLGSSRPGSIRPFIAPVLMVAAVLLTVLFVWAMLRSAPVVRRAADPGAASASPTPQPGVVATLEAGAGTIQAVMPVLSFHLEPDESLDPRLPAGTFAGRFTLTFSPGGVRFARLGALLQGGSVIMSRRGEILLSDYAGDEPAEVLTRQPVFLGSRVQSLTYEFVADAGRASALRALWQPEDSSVALPLPGAVVSPRP
jgi:hypothetical protein